MIESIGIDPISKISIFQGGVGAVAPTNATPPVISGNLWLGQTLSTTDGVWDDNDFAISGYSYQWQRDGVDITGATAATYVTVGLDGDADITCNVTATNAGGGTPATSNALLPKLPTMAFTEGRTSTTLSPSFATVDFGAAPAAGERRHIIVAAMTTDLSVARTITAVTIGGVAATRIVKGQADGTSFTIAELWIAEVPTGANGTVVLTGAGNRSAIAAYRAMNMISVNPVSAGGILSSGNGPAIVSPQVGDLIVGATVIGSAGAMTWTGLTEDYDVSAGSSHQGSSAHLTAASTAPLSVNSSPLSGRVLAVAVFEGGFGVPNISVLNAAIFAQPDDTKVSVTTLQSAIFAKPDDTKVSVATLQSAIFVKPQ